MQQFDKESADNAKTIKRQQRGHAALAAELEQLKRESSDRANETSALIKRSRNAIHKRDAHLAAAETQVCVVSGLVLQPVTACTLGLARNTRLQPVTACTLYLAQKHGCNR